MKQETGIQRPHTLTIDKVVEMSQEYESLRERFLNRAKWKFLGSGACTGLAFAGGVALAIGQGKVEGPAGAWVAAESFLATGSVTLFGFGLGDKSEADDASRKSALLQGALVAEEAAAGELLGRGTHYYEDEIVGSVLAGSVHWGDGTGQPER